MGFSPAIRQEVRNWALQWRTGVILDDLAETYNPAIRDLVNYYGAFPKSALGPTLLQIDRMLVWSTLHWFRRIARQGSGPFVYWSLWYGGTG